MRSELMQEERMAAQERLGEMESAALRLRNDIRRRMRHEATMREEQEREALGDLQGD